MWNQWMFSQPRIHTVDHNPEFDNCNCMISCFLCCSDPWSWIEDELRRRETAKDSFEIWQQKLVKAVDAYTGKENLVGSLARRLKTCLDRVGSAIDD